MSKKAILFSLLSISAFFVVLEFFLQKPQIEIQSPASKAETNTDNKQNNSDDQLANKDDIISMKSISADKFKIAKIEHIRINNIDTIDNQLFRRISITPQEDNIQIVSAYFDKATKPFVKVYEFQATEEMSVSKIFNLIQSKLDQSINENEKSIISINQNDQFGEHSFYFNNKTNYPGMVFLIIKSEDKILGFEYNEENHPAMKRLFDVIFPRNGS